jgi:glycogen debranching enzyme
MRSCEVRRGSGVTRKSPIRTIVGVKMANRLFAGGVPDCMLISPEPTRTVEGIHLETLVGVLCEIGRVEQLRDLGNGGPLLASAGGDSLFHCLFGRDALRMALDLIDDFPAVAERTLVDLARLQGVAVNPRSEEEPGRILHEFRAPDDPHAARLLELGWDFPYYGTVDATPQWINLLGAYCERYGVDLLETPLTNRAWQGITLRDSLEAALAWLVGRLEDPAGAGYLWVRRDNPRGIANQVWEDSYDAYYHADGTLFDAAQPYAPVALQGYAYDALLIGADLLERVPSELAFSTDRLRQHASRLRARVLDEFWLPELRTFALALTFEADKPRPARVVGSDPGHLLASGLLDGDNVASVREMLMARLFEDDLLGTAGIRTKSTTAARYSAGSYHNGSIWPMDCGVIADGMRRHGCFALAEVLENRILAACCATGGFPEFLRGDGLTVNTTIVDGVQDGELRRLEQPPQMHQGWTATRVWRILRDRDAITESSR